ncbi:hypothetical protein CB0940_03935 [Cercospora beticola]|uniref:Metallo-beta-lactamase domain-containing protein n=1 Tax=Cercospora beticola TaxID=122368 RepID=A0A2G5HJH0_CERBT|nr:hypothetical protein CB0940_03935 [Cercospora beticola]PIA92707.1 hypothetical protein CB0940_03935 [Cercospora beticola]WPB01137.1 hypothetical protein RHO25_005758 [Cercospora beticola]
MFGSRDSTNERITEIIGVPNYQYNPPLPNGEGLVSIPDGDITVTVKLINPVTFGPAKLSRLMQPDVPFLEVFEACPSFSFLLEHPSGKKLVWDLGIRHDYMNSAPTVASYISKSGYNIQVQGHVADTLSDNGVDLNDVEAVIWSHWHWDHVGDPSTFPKSTALVVGPGFQELLLPAAPTNPESPISESAWDGRELRELDFAKPGTIRIGQFPAIDYFGDGSVYLLNSPGHAVGHLCALVRTTVNPDTFIFLGGDICHYSGIMRPSIHLPVPKEISPHPVLPHSSASFCPGHAFEELQTSRGRQTDDTLYDMAFGYDIPLATDTVKKLQELDVQSNVLVIIAHDAHVGRIVDHFPLSLNAWKDRGWGAKARWAWLKDLEGYWKSKGVLE